MFYLEICTFFSICCNLKIFIILVRKILSIYFHVLNIKNILISTSLFGSGKVCWVSHLETDCLDTSSISASCSCDSPFCFLINNSFSENVMYFTSFVPNYTIFYDCVLASNFGTLRLHIHFFRNLWLR